MKNGLSAVITINSEYSTQWFMPFYAYESFVIASTIIVVVWLKDKKRERERERDREREEDDLPVLVELPVCYFSDTLQRR